MSKEKDVVVVLDNLRSAVNVGSILRTAAGFGLNKVYMCGITAHPKTKNDTRLPHIIEKAEKMILKTSLGGLDQVGWDYFSDTKVAIEKLKADGYQVIAVEQDQKSKGIAEFKFDAEKYALVLGNEVEGVSPEVIGLADDVVEIPMLGDKNSHNVTVASAVILSKLFF